MKFYFNTLILLVLISQLAYSQTDSISNEMNHKLLNKKGKQIGPEKGDFALGIDAAPFLDYLGNMLKISDEYNPAPVFGFTAQNPGMIYLKYMQSDTKAIGLAFRFGYSRDVDKDGTGFDDNNIDKYISSALNLGLSLNLERSPFMKSRLRGYYGYTGMLGIQPYSGNSYDNPGIQVMGTYSYVDATSDSQNFVESGGTTVYAGIGGYTGVEYFITPKIALSGQFNLILSYAYQMQRKYIPETGAEIIMDAGRSEFMMDNLASGSIKLMCYF